VRAAGGALAFPNGAFWPYRLITSLWAQMYTHHQSRLSLETNTPVTKIAYDDVADAKYPYTLHTPRGPVRAGKVIHATNGYTGHLLPALRGKIYPLRGTMSTQKATPEFGRHGHEWSWAIVNRGHFHRETNVLEAGLYYGNQNAKTSDIFFGGEKAKINELLISDDSEVGATCAENIATALPRFFTKGWPDGTKPEVLKVWSGIMGFTADRLPLVGPLPPCVTGRGDKDRGEWIAAGFNGYGMPLCWSSGEAVAKMLLGIDVDDFLPEVFLASQERLQGSARMAIGPALAAMFGGH